MAVKNEPQSDQDVSVERRWGISPGPNRQGQDLAKDLARVVHPIQPTQRLNSRYGSLAGALAHCDAAVLDRPIDSNAFGISGRDADPESIEGARGPGGIPSDEQLRGLLIGDTVNRFTLHQGVVATGHYGCPTPMIPIEDNGAPAAFAVFHPDQWLAEQVGVIVGSDLLGPMLLIGALQAWVYVHLGHRNPLNA